MKKLTTIHLILLLLVSIPFDAKTQVKESDCNAILYARIVDTTNGQALAEAKLELLKNGHPISKQYADYRGRLKLSPYDCDQFDIMISLDGYYSQKILDLDLLTNNNVELEVSLLPTVKLDHDDNAVVANPVPSIRLQSSQMAKVETSEINQVTAKKKSKSRKFIGHVVDIIKEIKDK